MPAATSLPGGDPPRLALPCTVLRPAHGGDATLGGISSAAASVVLTDPLDLMGRRPPAEGPPGPGSLPELQLRERRGFLIACPPDAGPRGDPYAFGGNWLWSSDTRFPEPAPIAVHDRDLRLERIEPGVARNAITNLPLDPAPEHADDSHARGADGRGAPSR